MFSDVAENEREGWILDMREDRNTMDTAFNVLAKDDQNGKDWSEVVSSVRPPGACTT